jgi:hypothetical protein
MAEAGVFEDSKSNPGRPLRKILERKLIPHTCQADGKDSGWLIPSSGGNIEQCRIDP